MRLPTVSPRRFEQLAWVALGFLTLIILTGVAVRVTGSGLGCPDWPRCYDDGPLYAATGTHSWIEFGNRLLTFAVGLAAIAPFAAAFRRRPYRRDLVKLSALLPLGVVAQGLLGGLTVILHLAPVTVMAHHLLSIAILVAAFTLVWRARHEPGARPRHKRADARWVWSMRSLAPLGALTIFAGTLATATGPHAGGSGTGDEVQRLTFFGAQTLDWAIHQHGRIATVLGLLAAGLWFYLRRRPEAGDRDQRRALTALCALLLAQGVVGISQYLLELPAELVWVHVALASLSWLAVLWAVAAAGRLEPAQAPVPAGRRVPA
jgi:cytochrome c oxidase assembly protein subunit 15